MIETPVSSRADALRRKLRDAQHAGAFFSADDVAGMLGDLKAISDGERAMEVEASRPKASQNAAARRPSPVPVGTFFFQPAH